MSKPMGRRRFLAGSAAGGAAAGGLLLPSTASAATTSEQQANGQQGKPRQPRPERMRRDREIASMIREVDPARLERSVRTLAAFHTRNTLSAQDDPDRGIGAARDWLYDEFQKIAQQAGGRMEVAKQSFVQPESPRIPEPTTITNVVATLRGTQEESVERVYIISGHYDSRCGDATDAECFAPGANDDASGVAAVLEAARVMAPHALDATVIFMAVAGEEQGLYGSTHSAEEASKQGMDIHGMFNNDVVGNGSAYPRMVRAFSQGMPQEPSEEDRTRSAIGGENDSVSRQLARYIDAAAHTYTPSFYVWMVYRTDRFLRGGDQMPFLERGYPAVRMTEPREEYEHQHQNVRVEDGVQYGDLVEFVDFDYLAEVTRVNVAALSSISRAPAAPGNARILVDELTNDTTLAWDANPEPDLDGYEVVWRDTASPVWTHSRWAGRTTRFTVEDVSKDNYFFGVRAVDRDGHRSPVSFPLPSR